MDKELAAMMADTPLVRASAKIAARFHNFGLNLHMSAAHQTVVPRMLETEAKIEALRKRQFDLQLQRNMTTYGLPDWGYVPEPAEPSEEEKEILGTLLELSTSLCHDLKGLEHHALVQLQQGVDA